MYRITIEVEALTIEKAIEQLASRLDFLKSESIKDKGTIKFTYRPNSFSVVKFQAIEESNSDK